MTTIGDYAFSGCSGLTGRLVIPEGVTTIGGDAFSGCEGLTGSLNIPEGVTTIGDYAFYWCIGLTGDLIIPEGVTTIGVWTFYGCSGFTGNLKLPDSVTKIAQGAFYGCSGLTGNLIIPSGVTEIGVNDVSYEIGAFGGCSGFTGNLIIPEGVTIIGSGAFRDCSGLTGSLNIPESVTTISHEAFAYCSGLTGNFEMLNSVPSIWDGAFSGWSGLTGDLIIPEGVTEIGYGVFSGCSGLTGNLIIPEGVTTIGDCAFYNCSGLTGNLIIPAGVTTIGDLAFFGCSGFTGDLIIPEGVTEIGYGVFSGCSGFTGDLIIPEGVTEIGYGVFYGCSGFTGDLIIPEGLTTIGNGTFSGCSGFTGDLIIPEGVMTIGDSAFSGCSGIKSVEIPASVEKLEDIFGGNYWGGIKHITVLGKQTTIPRGLGYTFVHAYSDSVIAKEASKWHYTFIPIDAPEVTEYRVSTVQELLKAIGTAGKGSYRHVILADGIYNIAERINFERLVSVTLEAEHPGKAEIHTQDWNVISVNQCADIEITGCILSNLRGQTDTVKDLVQIQNSYDVKVRLYGQSVITNVSGVNPEINVPMTMEEQKAFASKLAEQEGIIVAEGEKVTVEITVSDAENTLTAQDREAVDQSAEAEKYKIGRYLDIAMSIQAGANSKQVTHTDEPIRLVLDIPWELRREERIFCLLRLHDGEIVLLEDLDNDPYTITIETDRFSSYSIVYQDAVSQGGAISGTLKSFGDATKGALVQLFGSTGNVIAQTTVTGSSGAYELEAVEQGSYTLTVSKAGHVTRSYAVTLEGEAPELNAEIRLKGDINGDGKVDSLDKRMIFGHIAGSTTLTGYEFQVGDVDGSGRIDALDKRMIYGHIAGTSPLW